MESLEAGRAGNGMEAAGSGGGIFGLLRTISYFTYEMVDKQGKIAMEGNVIKLGFENN